MFRVLVVFRKALLSTSDFDHQKEKMHNSIASPLSAKGLPKDSVGSFSCFEKQTLFKKV